MLHCIDTDHVLMLTGAYYALSPISFIIGNPCNILFVLFSLKCMFSLLTICQVATYSLSWITFRSTHHSFLPLSANYTAQYPHKFPRACALLFCKIYTVFQKNRCWRHVLLSYSWGVGGCFLLGTVLGASQLERVLKKQTQVKVPLPSKKCSVSRVKVLVQKMIWVWVKE